MLNHRILLVTAAAATITPPPTVRAPEPLTFWAAGRASIVLAQAVANGTLEPVRCAVLTCLTRRLSVAFVRSGVTEGLHSTTTEKQGTKRVMINGTLL